MYSVLTRFHTVTEKNVRETIQKMFPKTCQLDPIPASLLLECIDETALVLTYIFNACLSAGSVPEGEVSEIFVCAACELLMSGTLFLFVGLFVVCAMGRHENVGCMNIGPMDRS